MKLSVDFITTGTSGEIKKDRLTVREERSVSGAENGGSREGIMYRSRRNKNSQRDCL